MAALSHSSRLSGAIDGEAIQERDFVSPKNKAELRSIGSQSRQTFFAVSTEMETSALNLAARVNLSALEILEPAGY